MAAALAGVHLAAAELTGGFLVGGETSRVGTVTVQDSLGGSGFLGESAAGAIALAVGAPSTINNAPEARNLSAQRLPGGHLKVSLAKLVALARDVDGDAVSLGSFDVTSANGARVFRDGNWLIYLNPGTDSPDQLNYRVTDGLGESGNGTIFVGVRAEDTGPSNNLVSISQEGTAIRILFAGIPSVTYRVQATPSLSPPTWTTIGSITAGPDGSIEFLDPSPAGSTRFYRTVAP